MQRSLSAQVGESFAVESRKKNIVLSQSTPPLTVKKEEIYHLVSSAETSAYNSG